MGVKREVTHAGGGPQPEERHGMAAEILMIDRCEIEPCSEGFRINASVPNTF
jgi:hypothetical protein